MTRDNARKSSMKRLNRWEMVAPGSRSLIFNLLAIAVAVGITTTIGLGALSGCASDRGEDRGANGESGMELGETENSETESDDGEESGESLALDETYDVIRKGARLILRYDASSNAFVGTVQNTTEDVLNRVRIEVHLSNGTELGPTTPVDLAPDQTVEVSLAATEEPFTGWTPHAEVGEGEHGSGGEGGEGGGEHGSGSEGGEGGGEHDDGGEGGEGGGEHGGGGEGNESGGEHGNGG